MKQSKIMIKIDVSSLKTKLSEINKKLEDAFKGSKVADILTNRIQNHLQNRFPGSTHYAPSKVYTDKNISVVDIPDASRAYHNIEIYPVKADWLMFTIDDKFVKTKHVHQDQDSSILPSLDELQITIFNSIDILLQ